MNKKRLWNSTTESNLDNDGIIQAKKLNKKIFEYGITKVYCSPSKRALKTASIVLNGYSIKVNVCNELKERFFGELEGCISTDEAKNLMSVWELNSDLGKGVERIQDMYFNRIKPFLDNLVAKCEKDDVILILSHSWVGRLINFYFNSEKNTNVIFNSPKNCFIYEYDTRNCK